nr:RpiB/LacA/LacB family sugar-phosphate isomerase [Achromobacter sp. RTa]
MQTAWRLCGGQDEETVRKDCPKCQVRAALCANGTMARLSRQHNDANVLALGSRIVGFEVALDCVRAFLNTAFEGGRHQRRVDSLSMRVPAEK